jgi:hypothetical protein
MHNCRDITALVSKGLDKKLSFRERLAIRWHFIICSGCRNFQVQSRIIRKAAHRYTDQLQNRYSKKP